MIHAVGVDTSKQRLDSTAVRSAIRNLTQLGILVETAAKFLRELRRTCPDRYAEVDREVLRKYVERCGNGCFANTRPSESSGISILPRSRLTCRGSIKRASCGRQPLSHANSIKSRKG